MEKQRTASQAKLPIYARWRKLCKEVIDLEHKLKLKQLECSIEQEKIEYILKVNNN